MNEQDIKTAFQHIRTLLDNDGHKGQVKTVDQWFDLYKNQSEKAECGIILFSLNVVKYTGFNDRVI